MNKISTEEELENFIQRTIHQAQCVGDQNTVIILQDAVKSSYTGSERLGNLKQAFLEMIDKVDFNLYPEGLKEQVLEIVRQIDRAFRKANQPF